MKVDGHETTDGAGAGQIFCGMVLIRALLFWPAGTFDFWNGWLLMGILFVPMFAAGLVMLFRCPICCPICCAAA